MKDKNKELVKKIMDFWKNHDNVTITRSDLKSSFSSRELVLIFGDEYFANLFRYNVLPFKYKLINDLESNKKDQTSLFTKENIEEIYLTDEYENRINKHYIYSFAGDDVLLSLLNDSDLEDEYDIIVDHLNSDEYRIKALDIVKSKFLAASIIRSFDSDELKLKYLNKVVRREKTSVISSLKSDSIKERYVGFFTKSKGEIIASFSSDELKLKYLDKYHLSNSEKSTIVASLKDKNLILQYLFLVTESDKIGLLYLYDNKEFLRTITYSIDLNEDNCKKIFDALVYHEDLAIEFFKKLDNSLKENLLDENTFNYYPSLLFKLYAYVEDKSDLHNYINHGYKIPQYCDDYSYLLDDYGYDLNHSREEKERFKKHFFYIASNHTLEIIRYLNNDNIKALLYSEDEVFYKIMGLFDKEKLHMDITCLNDVLSAYLQKVFRDNNLATIYMFHIMSNYISQENFASFEILLNQIPREIINKVLNDNSLEYDEFIDLVKSKQENSIKILSKITNNYVAYCRNKFVNSHFKEYEQKVTVRTFNKSLLIKYMLNNYPSDLLTKFFDDKAIKLDYSTLGEEELKLLKNKDLIKEIIMFLKDTKSLKDDNNKERKKEDANKKIPDYIKNNLRIFNKLFEKLIVQIDPRYFIDIDVKKDGFLEIDNQIICEVLKNLNVEAFSISLSENSGNSLNKSSFETFEKMWFKYKIAGWSNELFELSNSLKVIINPSTISDLIEHFDFFAQRKNLSVLDIIELAYGIGDSGKVATLFGAQDYDLLVTDPGPYCSSLSREEKINNALKYVKVMYGKKYITVPSMDKDYDLDNDRKVNAILGNFTNMINLTYGERTRACYRIGGFADSLLENTLDNENGFAIRFNDSSTSAFVGRVVGFRNGNSVFLNSLYIANNDYSFEEILDVLKRVCDELIESTKDSLLPIENVFLVDTKNISKYPTIPTHRIVRSPFNPKDIYTDYVMFEKAIILSTTENEKEYVPLKLNQKDVPRYPTIRDKVRTYFGYSAAQRVEQLKILEQYLSSKSIDSITTKMDESIKMCISGEDWCIYLNGNDEVIEFIMNNSRNKEVVKEEIEKYAQILKKPDNLSL